MQNKFDIEDCCLFIDGKEVQCEDDLIRLAGDLSTGTVPTYLEKYDLSEYDIQILEEMLAKEIFLRGKCLTPDEEYLGE
tara:strand:- start:3424 stop:3660 length:237 start_codon:yes stop_codon:yes gene_type:complete